MGVDGQQGDMGQGDMGGEGTGDIWPRLPVPHCHQVLACSDITNTQVGISGETVPEGGNLCIY